MFATTPELREVPVVELFGYSPKLPAFALSFVDVPTMPAVLDGVMAPVVCSVVNFPVFAVVPPIAGGDARYVENPLPLTVLLADSVVNAPVEAVVDPTGPGAAKVAPPSCAALTLVLQVSPVPLVQFSALADVLQLGTANAVGAALDPVALASTLFAATGARPPTVMFDQAGAVLDPVETMA